jgi:lipopolysaccharide export LptBFGC system permease protein LptF
MGKNGFLVPWLAGWLPNLILFGVSLRLIVRLR